MNTGVSGRAGGTGARWWDFLCDWGCFVGGSGIQVPLPDRGGGAPPTPPPRSDLLSMSTSDGLRRNSRVLTRCEEPAHGAGALPRGLRRGARSGQGHRALRVAVEAGGLRRLPRGRAAGHAPALAGGTQAGDLLLGELDAR